MTEKFPEVQGGGSLILAWQVKNKRILVVGGGEVSIRLNAAEGGSSIDIDDKPR